MLLVLFYSMLSLFGWNYDLQQGVFINITWITLLCGRHVVCLHVSTCVLLISCSCCRNLLAQVEPAICGQQMRIGGLVDLSAHQILFVC